MGFGGDFVDLSELWGESMGFWGDFADLLEFWGDSVGFGGDCVDLLELFSTDCTPISSETVMSAKTVDSLAIVGVVTVMMLGATTGSATSAGAVCGAASIADLAEMGKAFSVMGGTIGASSGSVVVEQCCGDSGASVTTMTAREMGDRDDAD